MTVLNESEITDGNSNRKFLIEDWNTWGRKRNEGKPFVYLSSDRKCVKIKWLHIYFENDFFSKTLADIWQIASERWSW